MKMIVLLISMLMSGCLSNKPGQVWKESDETGGFVEYTDKRARTVDLIPLREKTISPGNKEIRVWVGFGIVSPEDLLVINIDGAGNISGQKVLIYDRNPKAWKDEPEELEYFLQSI